ncbi:probable endochitinase [Topomyia yanbarensis]|uniref:probable endochitinase n=1 Tax=Topomyia yanbarensis TaxID=2498891 RepID=UPI00273B3C52|nr:probable endochitinase [Topomyia yanbarensis]
MKSLIALISLVGIGTVSAQNCSGRPDGSFEPNSKRCDYYYSCTGGLAIPLTCPSGYHYNPVRKQCDYPSKAGCIKCPSTGFRNLAVDGSCNKFIQCYHGTATDRECPNGLNFDIALGQCNLEDSVKC